jgi:hypothetical protein
VGERERRDIGDLERDLDEPDDEELDEDDEDDRLIGVLVLCCFGEDDGTTSAFAKSGRGVGSRDLSANVLTIYSKK